MLGGYFATHPIKGQHDSTDFYFRSNEEGYIDEDDVEYYGETGLGAKGNAEYLIFPVWWRENNAGKKDYQFVIHQYGKIKNCCTASFNTITTADTDAEEGKSYVSKTIPFPYLEYSTEELGTKDISELKFYKDEGSFTQAFPQDGTVKTVATGGLKVKFTAPTDKEESCAIGFYLKSTGSDGEPQFSCSVPYYNGNTWKDKRFDVSLTNLMFANVSTMQYDLPKQTFKVLNSTEATLSDNSQAFLVGFNSPATEYCDKTPRDYTDFIMLVIPLTDPQFYYNVQYDFEPYEWTFAAEDLGGTDDWDFNDVVFTFTDVIEDLNSVNKNKVVTSVNGPRAAEPIRVITVKPLATGGTMPVYITFTGNVGKLFDLPEWGDRLFSDVNDEIYDKYYISDVPKPGTYILGTEVHKWLGAPNAQTFVNVGTHRVATNATPVKFSIPLDEELDDEEYSSYGSKENSPLYGFAILVDKEDKLQKDARDGDGFIELSGYNLGSDTYQIGIPKEDGSGAPQMLLIGADWEWPTERTKISDAYPYFNNWISDPKNYWYWWYHGKKTDKVTKK